MKNISEFLIIISFFLGVLSAVLMVLSISRSTSGSYEKLEFQVASKQTNDVNDILNGKVKLFCWVMTYPKDKFKWKHVQRLWGKHCSKLIFMTSNSKSYKEGNIEVVEVYSGEDSRDTLWTKVQKAFNYTYEKYYHEYDWFMKADLDSFLIMENYKRVLQQYDPNISYLLGHRYVNNVGKHGFMAGMSYVLSKEALKRFHTKLVLDECPKGRENEDLFISVCLERNTIQVDTRDDKYLHTLFPVGPESALDPWTNKNWWYPEYQYYPINFGLNCCSTTPLGFHYINLENLYLLNYLIYHVFPFGIRQEYNDRLPEKISFTKLLLRSIGANI